jgi:GntR family transcriptional repressor for pyruvate dehydrogenase complex
MPPGDNGQRRIERPKPRAQAVADALRDLVQERHLVPGDRLPSEAELVDMLGVGRSSVREGVQVLESLGLVEVEQGKGMFLASDVGGGLGRVITWAYAPEDRLRLIADLIEARLVIEVAQARLAAVRAEDNEIEEFVQEFGPHEGDNALAPVAAEAEGLKFHHHLARLVHNDVLLVMANALEALYGSLVVGIERTAEEMTGALHDHDPITAAIARRDPDAAGEAMRVHLEQVRVMVEGAFARETALAPEPTVG